jgi:hypothetical protein
VKKFKSCHKKDVTCLDINKQNNIATCGDNLICFWDSFNAKLIKKVKVLPHMTPTHSKHANMICALKYAKYESNQFLLVFMTEGQVLCLDTIRE